MLIRLFTPVGIIWTAHCIEGSYCTFLDYDPFVFSVGKVGWWRYRPGLLFVYRGNGCDWSNPLAALESSSRSAVTTSSAETLEVTGTTVASGRGYRGE